MTTPKLPEVWLRGPIASVPGLLQPIAHALMQAREEVIELMNDFPEEHLWSRPAGVAAPGFHLKHIPGVIDRLFTYAEGSSLNEDQFTALKAEGVNDKRTVQNLVEALSKKVDWAIEQLSAKDENSLLDVRTVGRAQLPSTVLGLLFHSAEHTMRHVGQLLVTVRMIKSNTD